jgi:hypothetical protein
MKFHFPSTAVLFAVVASLTLFVTGSTAQVTRQIHSSGTTQPQTSQFGTPGVTDTEIDSALSGDDDDGDLGIDLQGNVSGDTSINRSIAPGPGTGPNVVGKGKAKSNPELTNSFDGLNFFDQRFANGGNQFSVEPPDQAICAGNGYVLESTNDVLKVFGSDGSLLAGPIDLNTFYGYAPAINRGVSPLQFGQSVTDPTCHFDPDTQRWFHVVLTLDRAVNTSQTLNGKNHLDIAVSNSSSPLGSWTIYRLPVQDDGTDGTPDHNCQARISRNPDVFVHAQCLGDYPHIGMDANGLYITTNEFELFTPGRFQGAQIYAISKRQLAALAPSVNVVQFDTKALAPSLPFGIQGFTVFPALSPSVGDFRTDNGGTEFFLSSLAVFSNTGAFDELVTWKLTNTQSLDSVSPAVGLAAGTVKTQTYAVPPNSTQKAGPIPLANCVALTTCFPLVGATGRFDNAETVVPSNDSRLQQVSYANGKLWGALDTAATVNGHNQAAIAYFVVNPSGAGSVINQGVIAVANNNVTYPALAVTSSGRGILAFSELGGDHYPSAGYVSLDSKVGAGDVHIVAEGAAPQDGFSGYRGLANPVRPRWGDYGAAAVDGSTIWFASEYIAHSCDFTTFQADFTCGGNRGALGNWATRVSQVQLK